VSDDLLLCWSGVSGKRMRWRVGCDNRVRENMSVRTRNSGGSNHCNCSVILVWLVSKGVSFDW
jgi:hypothetical protein